MKRIFIVSMFLTILGFSVTSYASSDTAYLIYKLSTSVKGVDDATSSAVSVPLKGYLVLKYDWPSDGTTYDLNDVALILYGQTISKNKVYVQLDYSDSASLDMDFWSQGGSYTFFNLYSYSPFGFEFLIFGKKKMVDIGGGKSMLDCSPSLKGTFWVTDGMLLEQSRDIDGTGNISATLWLPETKAVNSSMFPEMTLNGFFAAFFAQYNDVTPAP